MVFARFFPNRDVTPAGVYPWARRDPGAGMTAGVFGVGEGETA
jgi:hypothetical protein